MAWGAQRSRSAATAPSFVSCLIDNPDPTFGNPAANRAGLREERDVFEAVLAEDSRLVAVRAAGGLDEAADRHALAVEQHVVRRDATRRRDNNSNRAGPRCQAPEQLARTGKALHPDPNN